MEVGYAESTFQMRVLHCALIHAPIATMEIIAEILFQIVIWILEALLELVIQVGFGALGEVLGRVLKKPTADFQSVHPWWAAAGYAVLGAAMGFVSLLVVPTLMIQSPMLRMANLVFAPLLTGASMAALGAWRRKKGQAIMRLDTFAYGVYFGFAMSLVRYFWGH